MNGASRKALWGTRGAVAARWAAGARWRCGARAVAAAVILLHALPLPLSVRHAQAQVKRSEDDASALVADGKRLLGAKRYEAAGKALDAALALNPRRIDAYILRAAVYAAQSNFSAGIAVMRTAAALAPHDLDVQNALGAQLVLGGVIDEGVALLAAVVARDAKRYDAQSLLAHTYVQRQQWRLAVGAFDAYFAARPAALASADAVARVEHADALLRSRLPGAVRRAEKMFHDLRAEPSVARRAALGEAWAAAAHDCKAARALLAPLIVRERDIAEPLLVDGQCALALGDYETAQRRGRDYLARASREGPLAAHAPSAAAGHALVAEALAARGELAAAKVQFELARAREPKERKWSVRLALVLRRAGDFSGAADALAALGPPAVPADDIPWWLERTELSLAERKPEEALRGLMPLAAAVPHDGRIVALQAQIALQLGHTDEALAFAQQARELGVAHADKIAARAHARQGDVALQQQRLQDAAAAYNAALRLDALAVYRRNAAAVTLALGDRVTAQKLLAGLANPSAADLALQAFAVADAQHMPAARALFAQAIAAAGEPLRSTIALDAARAELAFGEPGLALAALQAVPSAHRTEAHLAAQGLAQRNAAYAAVATGQWTRALDLLRDRGSNTQARCELVVVALSAQEREVAQRALRELGAQPCTFRATGDANLTPLFAHVVEGLQPTRAAGAFVKLRGLGYKGPAHALATSAARVVGLVAAAEAYRQGRGAEAARFVAAVAKLATTVGDDELAAAQGILQLERGISEADLAALEKLAARVPEAWLAIGIARERQGQPVLALEAWRKAKRAGVRHASLAEWIAAKERVWGKGDEP